jgi:hypothetical protein
LSEGLRGGSMKYSRYNGYEVDGRNVANVLGVFRLFPEVAFRLFSKYGLGSINERGQFVLEGKDWFPMPAWLELHDEIARTVGPSKMFEIGKQVPKNSVFPPNIEDIYAALSLIDVAYSMNHRDPQKNTFDPKTGRVLEGLGHYRTSFHHGEHYATIVSDGVPYPCELDRGIFTCLAKRFEATAVVTHAPGKGCRTEGASACHYLVEW